MVMQHSNEELRKILDKCLATLKIVEWKGWDRNPLVMRCVCCGETREDGHSYFCSLKELLYEEE
jgi:hypothetical protein